MISKIHSHSTHIARSTSSKTMKALVATALVLSSISIVISAYAANQILHSQSTYEMDTLSPQGQTAIIPEPLETVVQTDSEAQKEASAVKIQKVVYLTFDDGPGKYTDAITTLLQKRGIHATFFMIGSQLPKHKDAVNRTIEYGNYVGLHSMTHNKKKLYESGSSETFPAEYRKEQELMTSLTGTTPVLIRAPYGSKPGIDAEFRNDIADAGFKLWDWTVDSKDWCYPKEPDRIIEEVKSQVHRNREVILLHEKPQTVQALPDIIDYLEKQGYAFAVYKPEWHFPVNFAKDDRL